MRFTIAFIFVALAAVQAAPVENNARSDDLLPIDEATDAAPLPPVFGDVWILK
ncbi:hypothetical protein DL96DRAFT_1819697 [Flagelloscypha sp. PMI_526]|nr:hypothetical protein DL96DRAFT_1819697 [Flagelloscypha sp. PMI_526]